MTRYMYGAHGLIAHEDRFLVLQRSSADDWMPSKWDLPGGCPEPGEFFSDTFMRETYEETGIGGLEFITNLVTVVASLEQLPDVLPVVMVYRCYVDSDIVRLSDDHIASAWVTLSEMSQLDSVWFVKETLRVLELSDARAELA